MHGIRAHARALVTVGPATADHLPALRVALGLAVPGIVLSVSGRPDLIIYAVFGAFTGMYGRADGLRSRLTRQARAATILVTGVGVGVTLSALGAPSWILVVTEVGFAGVVSVVADLFGLEPAGPFYGIFALGAVATIPAGGVAPWVAVAICAATALFCLLLGSVGTLYPGCVQRTRAVVPQRPQWAGSLVHAGRYVTAIGVAGTAGVLLGVDHANWAMAAAAVPLVAADPPGCVHRGLHRLAGTFVGLIVTASILVLHPSPTVLAVCVMVLLFPTELFMARNYALALGFFTPLIMVMTDLAAPSVPSELVVARGIDTLIGVTAGVVAAFAIRGRARGTDPDFHPGGSGDRRRLVGSRCVPSL
ncbi:FUSC family protein [Prescottella sp. R16]|uniref:FUSC family protein n=1 Tax=Prescottella sp. R16 TaxID=3064529 RepID=UPI00272DEBF2|nr:FUSC family protein [Prescottella sp. R16]